MLEDSRLQFQVAMDALKRAREAHEALVVGEKTLLFLAEQEVTLSRAVRALRAEEESLKDRVEPLRKVEADLRGRIETLTAAVKAKQETYDKIKSAIASVNKAAAEA